MASSFTSTSPSRPEITAATLPYLSPPLESPHPSLLTDASQLPLVAPPSKWVSLFNGRPSSSSTKLKRYSPEIVNGVAKVPPDVVELGIQKWSKFLIGSFIGKKLPCFLVKKEIEIFLKAKDCFNLSCDGNRFFIEIPNPVHRQLLLEGGPIFIAGKVLIIREWNPSVEGQEEQLATIPLWINMVIPRELWTVEGIGFCASLFGTSLGMDKLTAKMSKTRFARVCVEVDVKLDYPTSIPVGLESRIGTVSAEYKWKAEACSRCAKFGHSLGNCHVQNVNLRANMQRWQPVSLQQDKETALEKEDANNCCDRTIESEPVAYTGTRPGEAGTIVTNSREVSPSVNRFNILADLEEDEGNVEELIIDSVAVSNMENVKSVAQVDGSKDHNSVVQPGESVSDVHAMSSSGANQEVAVPELDTSVEHEEGSSMPPTRTSREKEKNYLKTLDSCLDLCNVVLDNSKSVKDPTMHKQDILSVDKGGTFDPPNPETWSESIKQADKEIAMVMARMANPTPPKPKKKPEIKVKLVKGNSGGAILRSSTRNK